MKQTFAVSRGIPRARMLLPLVAVLALSLFPLAVQAGGVVTTCTETALRAALAGGGTVSFACDGTIVLANTLVIATNTTIDATGHHVTLSGGGTNRVLLVQGGVTFRLIGVMVAHGGGTSWAAGILSSGTTWLINSTFEGNSVTSEWDPVTGGAVGLAGGELHVSGCTFLNNRAQIGAAICTGSISGGAERVNITNSTFYGNSADYVGGAALSTFGQPTLVTVVNCTFANNTNGGLGGWRLVIKNTVMGGGTAANIGGFTNLTDLGGNLISDGSVAFTQPSSRTNTNPRFGTLGDYGGPTLTVSLLPDSPAINAGDCAATLPFDQRGIPRPHAGGCDSGAFEATVIGTNAGQFVFSSPDYRSASGAGSAVITVLRQSGTIGSAAVAFATQNGTAVGGADYTATNGILAFAEGEAIRTFVVALNPVLSIPKTINLSLSNPTGGASLGIYSNSVLTIGPQPLTECTDAALRASLAVGGVVTVPCDGVIVLTNTIVINNNTTLDARGHDVTLSGSNAVRLFWVNSNVNLTLVNLKLADGYALGTKGAYGLMGALGRGGAILNNGGILQASDCTFLHNRAEGGQGGDGRSAIGDVVLPGIGGRGQGGAICNLSGQVFLTNSVLNGNQVDGGRGGFSDGGYSGNGGDGMGGAVYSSGGFLALSGCLLTTNAMLPGPPGYTTFKSGINGSSAGGAVYLEGTDGLILTSRFEQNVGGGGGRGGSTLGGAVFQTGGRLELSGSLFASNRVSGGAAYQISGAPGLGGAGIGGGGALYLAGFAGITNCAIVSNQAEGGPYGQGGTLGDGKGGGIYSAGSLSAVNCTIANNSALGGATPGEGGSAFGGGIYGPALLNSVTLAENSALKRGGSLAVITVAQGGGIYGSATLRNSLLAGNWYNASST